MAEEIREHMMGHKLKDRIRDAYFLADPDDLQTSYLRYIDYLDLEKELKELKCEVYNYHIGYI